MKPSPIGASSFPSSTLMLMLMTMLLLWIRRAPWCCMPLLLSCSSEAHRSAPQRQQRQQQQRRPAFVRSSHFLQNNDSITYQVQCRLQSHNILRKNDNAGLSSTSRDDDNNSSVNNDWTALNAELVDDDDDDMDDSSSLDDWTPDHEKARKVRLDARVYAESIRETTTNDDCSDQSKSTSATRIATTTTSSSSSRSPYTEEEEEVIAAMGGKTAHPAHRRPHREIGFLGDSTLSEIATDYSVPVCYLADVLCLWGVPVPIDVDHTLLGDLVTGEQAFALLEAVNSLDVAALHDRYANRNIYNFCDEYGIDLQTAFEMAMKEGWSLPFGVQTCLRVEQEDELIRVLGGEGFER
jgi:hypothetical protein